MSETRDKQQRILEAIELAGRGRDDGSDPELARLAQALDARPETADRCRRSIEFDDLLRRVVRNVTPPEGLERRILDRLAHDEAPSAELPPTDRRLAAGSSRQSSRRRWMLASASAAAALLLVGVISFWPSTDYTAAQVRNEAVRQYVDAPSADAISTDELPPDLLAGHPFSTDIRRLPDTRPRRIDDFLGHKAIAYEMTAAGGERATLFVVPRARRIDGLTTFPPAHSQPATGRLVAAAWQTDDALYVLVVAGDDHTYQQLRHTGRSAV